MKKAVAYFRTSSAANVGQDKDSEARQRAAVMSFAARNDIDVVAEFYDAAVSGADAIDARPGFIDLLKRIASNGVRTILVETANRFARDLIVQEMGFRKLREMGVELIAVDSPNSFLEDTPTSILVRQVLGAVAQFDKAMTVAKLRAARERKKATTGKCEGRKSWSEMNPDLVKRARSLREVEKLPFPEIAAQLEREGFVSGTGKRLTRWVVSRMVQ